MSDVARYSAAGEGVVKTDPAGPLVKWNDYARLQAEVERLRKAGDWRPIETAPKDGKTVVLVVEYGYVYTGLFHNDGYCQDLSGAGLDPTHWMPLPKPPAKEGKQP